jgi:hypothetical protein
VSETAKAYDAAAAEPMPVGNGIDVAVVAAEKLKELGLNEIAEDIEARIRLGERKYGTRLKAFNGREPLMDLYQEVLDGINYSQQCVIEGKDDGSLRDPLIALAVEINKRLKNGTNPTL